MSVVLPSVRPTGLSLPESAAPVRRVDPNRPDEVASALQRCLGIAGLSYLERPQAICWGWETFTYRLQFAASPSLPAPLAGPLILRIYTSPQGVPRAHHEFAMQQRLRRLDFPVPEPLLIHTNCELFGGPFLLMERIPGETLFHTMLARPSKLLSLPARMAALHLHLHRLSSESLVASAAGFLDRTLDELGELIAAYELRGLQPGLDWLSGHGPKPGHETAIVHLDWHPLNLIRDDQDRLWALDWSEADMGDPHADVAMTLVLLRYAPVECRTWWDSIAVPLGRDWIVRRYWYPYSRQRRLDERRLSYFLAWAVLRRLVFYGRWLVGGLASTGSKKEVLRYLQRSHLDELCRAFHGWTGVEIRCWT
jgi:aminoglycoside phosphotransferase (APT) family kinase protein